MDNLGTEVVRFFNQYQQALAALSGVQETLRTDDAHTLKATLIESGLLERGVERERRRQERLRIAASSSLLNDGDGDGDEYGGENDDGGAAMRPSSSSAIASSNKKSTTSAPSELSSLNRLQTAVELLLSTNHHNNGAATAANGALGGGNNGSSLLMGASSARGGAATHIPMMNIEQRNIVQLKLQFLFDDLGKAVKRLQKAADPDSYYGQHGGAESDDDGENCDDEDESDEDDYQILRHHIFPESSSSSTGGKGNAESMKKKKYSRSKQLAAERSIVATKGSTAAAESAAGHHNNNNNNNNTRLTDKGHFKSLKNKSLLPSAIEDLRVLCEDLHEKLFASNQNLRISETQKEELLFRLNAREETLRGLRSHFLKELVGTVGNAYANGSASGGGGNTLINNPARFAGIPITFIEENDIEVARRIATAQIELDKIRSDHGKELWRQREGWAKRLEAKEKEIIQMQIMFRNALAALQGKHASTVSKIVDENATLKQNNVQVEHLALQRAEAFFEMKLNEKIAQLTAQYDGRISLLGDKLSAANNAFKQSLAELKAERREKRKLQEQLQEAERALDHALLIEIPYESERSAKHAAAELQSAKRLNEQLTAQLLRLQEEYEQQNEAHANEVRELRDLIDSLRGEMKAMEKKASDLQHDNQHLRGSNNKLKMEGEQKDSQIRTLINEVAAYRDKFLTMQNPTFLNENFKFGDDESGDENGETDEEKEAKKRNAFLLAAAKRAANAEDELLRAQASQKELSEEVDRLRNRLHSQQTANEAVERLSAERDKLLAEMADLKKQLVEMRHRYESTSKKNDEYKKRMDDLSALVAGLEEELLALQQQRGGGGGSKPLSRTPSSSLAAFRSVRPATVPIACDTRSLLDMPPGDWNKLIASKRNSTTSGYESSLADGSIHEMGIQCNGSSFGNFSSSAAAGASTSARGALPDFAGQGEQFLASERQLNANLRRKLADVNAQIRIATKVQEWPVGWDSKANRVHLVKGGRGGNNTSGGAVDAGGGAPFSTDDGDGAEAAILEQIEALVCRDDGGGAVRSLSRKNSSSATATTPPMMKHTSSAAMGSKPTTAATLGSSHETFAAPSVPVVESLPIPLSVEIDIVEQNKLFEQELSRRMNLLAGAMKALLIEKEAEYCQNAERDETLRMLQERLDALEMLSGGGDNNNNQNNNNSNYYGKLPPKSRPQSAANVRYNINTMPLPHSRLSYSGGRRSSSPSSAKFGAGFVISHRPQSGSVYGNSDHHHGGGGGTHKSTTRSGMAPHLQPYDEDMGVYEDNDDDDGDGEEGANSGDDIGGKRRGKRPSVVEAFFEGNGSNNNINGSRSGIYPDDDVDDDQYSLYYDSNGLPRYVKGFLPRKHQQREESSNNTSGRATGGAVKGRLTPRAPLTSRPASAAPTIASSSQQQQHNHQYGLGVGGGRWASLQNTHQQGHYQRPYSASSAAAGRQHNSDDEGVYGEEAEGDASAAAADSYRAANKGARHESTSRYIQPESFFNVRGRLQNGGHDLQRWEMSSAQIRRAASRGLVRGLTTSANHQQQQNRTDSPRYRPLPAEEGGNNTAATATTNTTNRGANGNGNHRASNSFVTSLSRPVTAGPLRPPTVLEAPNDVMLTMTAATGNSPRLAQQQANR